MSSTAEIFPELLEIEDEDLRERCEAVLDACVLRGAWENPADAPFVRDIAASEFNGIDHVRAVTRLVVAAAEICREILGIEIDRDHALAAGLLHDASKWIEYEPTAEGIVTLSAIGRGIPHAAYGAVEASRSGINEEIVNAISSHTPQNSLELRSVVAALLHHLDLALTDAALMASGRQPRFKFVLGREA
jgi:putative nucleotidyltransferase with HDIG domain